MITKKLLILTAVFCFASAIGADSQGQVNQQYAEVIGTWDLDLGSDTNPLLDVYMEKGKLAGKFTGRGDSYDLSRIKFTNSKLEFEWIFPGDNADIVMSYEVRVRNGKMEDGRWFIDQDEYPQGFTGKKKK